MKIIVSACLMGVCCRYNGQGEWDEGVRALMENHHLIPVCPEVYGGLPTPRDPTELSAGRVITCAGADVTAQYERGAAEVLKLAESFGCELAIMKKRSPSCGGGRIYDGTFTKTLTDGDGITVRLLKERGIRVCGEGENYHNLR